MDPLKADPDYKSLNTALELNEEEDKKEKFKKLCQILEDEFNSEIEMRENQIEQIELQICKARKLLHLLRYALIMSYYNKKDMQYNGEEEITLPETTDKQSRIHPAIKRLLSNNSLSPNCTSPRNKRKAKQTKYAIEEYLGSSGSKKIKLESESLVKAPSTTVVQPDNSTKSIRKKVKYQIIVGNISKWMPSLEDDSLTHKWMVYVRGPKESPDVSHFINKIVFHLHPSYKPHDVVEVCEPPYHLSRRGWGEFPVRVQIFFKESLNKPVDIVHNIKLDQTRSGRQTLGNETIVNLFLYEYHTEPIKEEQIEDNKPINNIELPIKNEQESEEIQVEDHCSMIKHEVTTKDEEHNYCIYEKDRTKELMILGNKENQISEIFMEHCYCLPASQENLPIKKEKNNIENIDPTNRLVYGLEGYLDSIPITRRTLVAVSELKNFLKSNKNSKIVFIGMKPQMSIIKSNLFNNINTNQYKLVLPKERFKNMGEALPYLFKRLPLYTKLAEDVNYKRLYPFTATTLDEFVKWNFGKQKSAEWSRARLIRKILVNEKIHEAEKWSTKAVLMFGRSHQYTFLPNGGLFAWESEEKNLLLTCFSSSCEMSKKNYLKENDLPINVDSDIDSSPEKKTVNKYEDINDSNLTLQNSFIRQTALDCGIILKPEIIEERFIFNGAERMIYEAVKCFAENLIRRAYNFKVCRKPYSKVTAINQEDVEYAINERQEFKTIMQFKNKRRNMEFFS